MSNEELTMKIQDGETELYSELWERVRRFVYDRARAYQRYFPDSVVETDDLGQAGYLALVEAVGTYDPEAGAGLLTHLHYYLRKAWRVMYGLRGKPDALDHAVSLDEELDDEGDTTRLETVRDPSAEQAFEQLEERVFIDELRDALDRALAKAPHGDVVRRRYFQGQTQREIGDALGCSPSAVNQRERAALRYLRQSPFTRQLAEFNYYGGCGLQSWKNSQFTSVEERYLLMKEWGN